MKTRFLRSMLIAVAIGCGLVPLAGIAAPQHPNKLAAEGIGGLPGVSINPGAGLPAPAPAERNSPSTLLGTALHDNGPFITHPGGGAGGADASVLEDAILSIFGFGAAASTGFRVADDFTVPAGGWVVDEMTFFTYQTGSTTTSTITGITVRIWDGVPGEAESNVVFGDTTTNVMVNTGWSNAYRSISGDITNSARPIMAVVADVGGTALAAGSYWVDFQFAGTLDFSGPWAPPITIPGQGETGNAVQFDGSLWAPAEDLDFGHAAGFPFLITGTGEGGGDQPTIAVDPAALSLTAAVDASDSADLSISNTGTGVLTWSIETAEPVAGSALAPRGSRLANDKVALAGVAGGKTNLQGAPMALLADVSMSQTTSTAPIAGNSISCNAEGLHADNSYFRRYYFDEHVGIGASATINSVDVSVEEAGGDANTLTVNLYTIPSGTPVDTIPLDALTLIGTSTLLVPPTALGSINVPVTANVADTVASDLVVEVFTPDGQPAGQSFFIGSTDTGQSHPSFLMASDCGITTPTDVTAIGFPGMHIIMVVNTGEGEPPPADCDVPSSIPWLSATPALGSAAASETDLSTITADAAGMMPGTYDALLCVESNDAVNPMVVVPVEFTVEAGENDGLFCDGFELGGDGSCGGDDPDPGPDVYTDRDEFLADVAPGFFENAFTDVPVGDAGPSLDFTDGNFSYTVSVTESVLFNNPGIISTGNPTDLLVVTFTGAPVTAVGGNFWGTDIDFLPVSTDVTVALSDGTVETFTSTGPTDFLGFVTAVPITSITIDASDTPVEAYPTMDNLIVGD